MTLPVALQLFSVRDTFEKDPMGTLKQVKEIGYDGVEFAGLFGNDPKALRAELDTLGLRAISAHVPFKELCEDIDTVITNYKILGCDYIVIPWLDAKKSLTAETLPETIESVKKIGKALKDAGFTLLYHNHNFEFEKMDGEYILDILYNKVDPSLLQTELDTCWVNVGGEDPTQYILKYSSRSPVVHLKDFVGGGKEGLFELIGDETAKMEKKKEEFDFRPVGYGVQNFPSILDAAVKAGAKWVVVEQDRSTERAPLEAVKMSKEYLATLGW